LLCCFREAGVCNPVKGRPQIVAHVLEALRRPVGLTNCRVFLDTDSSKVALNFIEKNATVSRHAHTFPSFAIGLLRPYDSLAANLLPIEVLALKNLRPYIVVLDPSPRCLGVKKGEVSVRKSPEPLLRPEIRPARKARILLHDPLASLGESTGGHASDAGTKR